jgi:peptidoglycan-associated lipoprotein
MMIRKILASFSAGLLFSTAAMAQGKLAEEADDAFQKGFYFNAIELYKKAYTVEKKASDKAVLIFKVAESYRILGDAQQAEVWYDKANKAQYPDPITYYWIGESLKQQGKYAEAIAAYNRYKEKKPGDARADAAIAACQTAQKWKDSPTRYSVDPEVLLNTPDYDFTPAFSDKKNEAVVFTSTRSGASGTETDQIIGSSFSDLFASTRDRLGKWSEPTKLPSEINTFGNEGAPAFNSKRSLMYFTRCPMEKKKVYGCDIWVTKKVGNNYSAPEMLALKANPGKDDTTTVGHPALAPDDSYMIFASDMPLPGRQGGRDLYYVKLDKDGKPVGAPVNLGPEINTPKDELFPFIRHDGSLYFASNGHPGMGGMDMFRAEKTGENKWGAPQNLMSPLNSAADDFGIIFDGENDRGYFTSNRPGGKGLDDIWRFYMPDLEFALQGTVYDKKSGLPLSGAKVSVVGTNGSNFSAITDDNGGFAFVENGKDRYIKENTSYSILVEKEDYLGVKDQVTTVGVMESTTFVKEYFLVPAGKGEVVVLPTVLYETDKFALLDASKDSLQVAYQTLIDNPTLVVELRSHTDARPTRTYKGGNKELSQLRAQSCVNYLVQLGIDPARLVPVGRGADEPVIPMDVIKKMATKEEQEAAHQRNRRTDLKILSWDYVPKSDQQAPAPNN